MKLTIRACLAGFLVAVIGLFGASPAIAQDGPTLTVDPVAAAGENTVVINGSGFPADLAGFLFPCAGSETAADWIAADPGTKQASCDIGALTPVTADADGNFSAELTVDVPENGLVIGMGDAAQTISTAVDIVVGSADAGADEAPAEEEAPAEDAEPAAESGDLAKTGVETPIMVGLGIALLGVGVGATRAGRRLGDR